MKKRSNTQTGSTEAVRNAEKGNFHISNPIFLSVKISKIGCFISSLRSNFLEHVLTEYSDEKQV